jgi:hypothetical protein
VSKPPKYRNKKTVVDGISFDSIREANRYAELVLLERSGVIQNLRRQVRFPLSVNGQLICTYVADAVYIENGHEIVEDTKSPVTRKLPVFRIKSKLLRALYGIAIRET